jgi:hypothetical protein
MDPVPVDPPLRTNPANPAKCRPDLAARAARGMGALGLALSLSVGSVTAVHAQGAADDTVREGRGYVTVGVSTLDLDAVNDRLSHNGYPTFPERRASLGIGGHAVHGRWLIGGEGQGLIGRTKDAVASGQHLEASLNAGYGFFNLGYLVAKQGERHAYPFVGIGGGGVQLTITERATPTFDEVLADPGRDARLVSAAFLIQLGFGVDQLFVLRTRDVDEARYEGGLVLGLRVGYVFTPTHSDWRLSSARMAGGPDFGMTGPYLRLVVGGGGRRSKR